jgi:molecular chaperone GrpE (heat shock protein)
MRQHYAQSNKQKVVETMSEYTHNDDVADMIYEKEQEIKLLKQALLRITAELNRLENEHARGL